MVFLPYRPRFTLFSLLETVSFSKFSGIRVSSANSMTIVAFAALIVNTGWSYNWGDEIIKLEKRN